jgi:hypothetical protein
LSLFSSLCQDEGISATGGKAPIPLPQMTVVVTLSPRRDYETYDDDLPFSLVTCTVQVQSVSGMWTEKQFLDDFLTDYLAALLEVRQAVNAAKYDPNTICVPAPGKDALTPDQSEHGSAYWLGPAASGSGGLFGEDSQHGAGGGADYAGNRKSLEREKSGVPSRADGVATVQPGLEEGRRGSKNMSDKVVKTQSGSDGTEACSAANTINCCCCYCCCCCCYILCISYMYSSPYFV